MMAMCYLCDLCTYAEYIGMPTMLKCHGESGAIVPMKAIDYGRDDPHEACEYYEPKEEQ